MTLPEDLRLCGDLSPRRLITITEAARRLEISREVAERLVRAEVGGPAYFDGDNISMAEDDLAPLIAQRDQWADCTEFGIAVKVAPAEWSPNEGRWIGWHRRLPDQLLDAAVGQYWAVRDAETLKDLRAAFVVALGGWIVHVASIREVTGPVYAGGKRAFTLGPASAAQKLAYEGKRLPPTRGRSVIRLGDG